MMKYLYVIFATVMVVVSCGKKGGKEADAGSSDASDKTLNKVENVMPNDTLGQEEKTDTVPVYELKVDTYSSHMLFKYDYDKKNLYHENTIVVEWPVFARDFDIEALRTAILDNFRISGTNIQDIVDDWAKNETADSGYGFDLVPVSKRVEESVGETVSETEVGEDGDMDEASMYYDTDCNLHIACLKFDPLHHYVVYHSIWSEDKGCGLGSCVLLGYNYLTFDCETNKVVRLSDVVKDKAFVLKQLKMQNAEADYEGLENVDELPDVFYIEGKRLVFVFDKYEITFGAAGCPHLTVDFTKYASALTPYGQKLLGLDE